MLKVLPRAAQECIYGISATLHNGFALVAALALSRCRPTYNLNKRSSSDSFISFI